MEEAPKRVRKGRLRLDLVGHRQGMLTVVEFAGMKAGRTIWRCACDCGGGTVAAGSGLKNGASTSCGCKRRNTASERCRARNETHGMRYRSEYKIWGGMIRRCTKPQDAGFERYGGRGIKVCERWLSSFEAFFGDVGPRPTLAHTLDRIENDGDYEPGNVQWATKREQANNRRSNHLVTYKGDEMTLREAIRAGGEVADRATVHYRIERLGWPIDRAVETPSPRQRALTATFPPEP